MATTLKSIVSFVDVPPGGLVSQPHKLNVNGYPAIPDTISLSRATFGATADAEAITVTNFGDTTASCDALCEHWHTLKRAFGSDAITALTPQPLVIGGSTGAPAVPTEVSAINGDGAALTPGAPVAFGLVSGSVRRASAASVALAELVGVARAAADVNLPVPVLPIGPLTLPTSMWAAITGEPGGLSPLQRYFLGTTPGTLTTAAPTAPGTLVVCVGLAITNTTFIVGPSPSILQ